VFGFSKGNEFLRCRFLLDFSTECKLVTSFKEKCVVFVDKIVNAFKSPLNDSQILFKVFFCIIDQLAALGVKVLCEVLPVLDSLFALDAFEKANLVCRGNKSSEALRKHRSCENHV
jgi:hypothetical protein